MKIKITQWRPLERGTLQGFADVQIVELGLTLHGCTVHRQGERQWCNLPGRPRLDEAGQLMREPGGKVAYVKVGSWINHGQAHEFSAAVLTALAPLLAPAAHQSTAAGKVGLNDPLPF